MRRISVVLTALLLTQVAAQAAPKLLLTPQRLRRLKRDRERQTPRWTNFERRVQTVPDSPERGFELALYYVVTGDEARGREATDWAKAHPCEIRQTAIVADWVSADSGRPDGAGACSPAGASKTEMAGLRDKVIAGEDLTAAEKQRVADLLRGGAYRDGAQLYPAAEMMALSPGLMADLRVVMPKFLVNLPQLLLLTLRPEQVERPDWQTHIASLALVSLQPNGAGAQFLQGWALEDRQMLQEGPGVAYELLWADPYLPGVGYQNMDPWLLDDETGTLAARTGWNADACWILLQRGKEQSEHCPADWKARAMDFGHLQLLPLTQKCIEITQPGNNSAAILKATPGLQLRYKESSGRGKTVAVPESGLWRVPLDLAGKVCSAR